MMAMLQRFKSVEQPKYSPIQMSQIPRVLFFSHISERDAAATLRAITKTLREHEVSIHHLIISTYEERLDGTREIGKL